VLTFRCYFIGRDGQFISVEQFKAKDDEEALMLARRLYEIHGETVGWRYGFEVWQGARRVHSELQA
jgi:hypothetical protein